MKKYIEEITTIIRILPNKISKKIKLIIILLSFAGLIEMISIGLLIPIISYFLNEKISINFFGYNFDTSILIKPENIAFFVLLIGFLYFFKSVYLTILEFNLQKFMKNANREMTLILYKKYIFSKYEKLVTQNSAILLRNLTSEIPRFVGGVIEPLFMISKEFFIIFFLLYLIISINLNISLIIILFSFVFIFFSKSLLQKTLKKISQENQFLSGMLNKSIIESIQGVKLIKSYKVENIFLDEISKTSDHLKRINYKSTVFRMLPRIWIEFVIILVLGFIGGIFYLIDSNLNNYLLFTSIFLISMVKIVPSSISIINVINNYNNHNASIKLLAKEIEEYNKEFRNLFTKDETSNLKLSFNESINLKNVYFKHNENENYILKGLSMKIKKKKEIVGIYGESGSGKTTLIDVLIGLLNISEGEYIIDGKTIDSKYYSNITKNIFGYVPQNTFIFDETIKNNILITAKDKKYDDKKIKDIIKLVELENFINSLPKGIDTLIGENGARISGGQKQRIGIARALINDPKILIFDEATSSVDVKIEENIFKTITNMSNHFSSVIISHNSKVRDYCNKIYKLENGILIED